MSENKWTRVDRSAIGAAEDTRPGLSYWSDVWRRFRGNPIAMLGLVMTVIIVLLAVFGPLFSPYSYSDQKLVYSNLPPQLELLKLTDQTYIFVHKEYKFVLFSGDGKVLDAPEPVEDNMISRYRLYNIEGMDVKLDYSALAKKDSTLPSYTIFINDQPTDMPKSKVWNKTYLLGSDKLGRDQWVRLLYGARISLTVGLAAALVNIIIGVLYGGIAGYEGGRIDNIMMRIVDIINSIPLLLIVILLMVVLNRSGLGTIILTIGLVYWVSMARQVRGQVMGLKEQEFVLAARTLGASRSRIIFKHLIPNALGPIVVSLTMSIPQAIFMESFLSFVGLGVSAPQASWGTLANDALGGIRSFPYQLIAPSVAIALTMFAFNFIGDGLRDALDPKLRK